MGSRRRLVDKRLYIRGTANGLKVPRARKLLDERERIERIVKGIDPYAFIIAIPGVYINGNFIRKVTAN